MSDSESDSDIPDAKTCDERCHLFAQITGTDTALAMFYLQDRKWNLETSVNAYFEESGNTNPQDSTGFPGSQDGSSDGKATNTPLHKKFKSNGASEISSAEKIKGSQDSASTGATQDSEPHRIRLLSWNIDGLDQNNIKNRTKGACGVILNEKPDVVFLQEVVPQSLQILEECCPLYQVIPAGHDGYFTAVMMKVGSVQYKEHTVKPFYSSVMSRNLLKVKAKIKEVDFHLITGHLESMASHTDERKKQLRAAFKEMSESCPDDTVVFGGDLNLRDKELQEVGGAPDGVLDLWEVTGKHPEAKFTWDLMRNDNLSWDKKFKPRCRFDRLYLRHASSGKKRVEPVYFELVGIERLKTCQRFPSDHWGILTHLNKVM